MIVSGTEPTIAGDFRLHLAGLSEEAAAMPERETFAKIAKYKYINLTTFRRDGSAVDTPVWFALSPDQRTLYVWTRGESYKVKRLRRNPACRVQPCDVTGRKSMGPEFEGSAKILEESEAGHAIRRLAKKYWTFWLFYGFSFLRPKRYTVFLEIERS